MSDFTVDEMVNSIKERHPIRTNGKSCLPKPQQRSSTVPFSLRSRISLMNAASFSASSISLWS